MAGQLDLSDYNAIIDKVADLLDHFHSHDEAPLPPAGTTPPPLVDGTLPVPIDHGLPPLAGGALPPIDSELPRPAGDLPPLLPDDGELPAGWPHPPADHGHWIL